MNRNKVLLVEDEASISRLFEYNLKKSGYETNVAANGRAGYELALTFQPDLIISDIIMPEVDGFQFRRKLMEDPTLKSIPFIFLTNKGEEEDILEGYNLEIEDYITKTSSPKIVIAKVASILKSLGKERQKVVGEIQQAADSMGAKVVPAEFPQFDSFDIKHWHLPFEGIPGGDFIDYYKIDEDNLVVILGDVMGKKWGAWYFAYAYAGYVRSAIRVALQSAEEFTASKIMARVNESLCNDEKFSEIFITLSIVIINKKKKQAQYCGAGDLPLIYKNAADKKVKRILSNGLLLGFSSDSTYEDMEISLDKDDLLILITDGILDSINANGEVYGSTRFLKLIETIDADKAIPEIQKTIAQYANDEFADDISLITITAK